MKILVVGGGIVGLSTAWALVRLGHTPVIYDRSTVPNPTAASYDQHRIIRLAYGERDGYCRMVKPAFQAWRRISTVTRLLKVEFAITDGAWMHDSSLRQANPLLQSRVVLATCSSSVHCWAWS